jgi:hypothetical protein
MGIENYIDPMTYTQSYHDTSMKTLLNGVQLPANQTAIKDLNDGLDNIFFHDNVGPFICKNLIQQLVTSNPSPDYVARVAGAFADNGSGVRGDLWAVTQAIVLDDEARGDVKTDPDYGHLREPALYICNLCRAFDVKSYDLTTTSDGYLNPQSVPMAQDVFRPASVFSYFSPFHIISFRADGTPVLGPEFDIMSASTSIKRANFINTMTKPNSGAGADGIGVSNNSPNGTKLDFTSLVNITGDAAALVDALDAIMMHSTMAGNYPDMRTSIINAVNATAASNPLRRVKVAVYLVGSSSQYQVQR